MNKIEKISIQGLFIIGSLLVGFDVFPQSGIISERLRNSQIERNIDESEVTLLINDLRADGSWGDIDYRNTSNTNWDPAAHSGRLLLICRAYNKPGTVYYHSEDIKNKIQKIIEFYIAAKPKSDNWWYNAIGAPINFGPALVLMKPSGGFGIEQSLLEKYANQLINFYDESAKKWSFSTTGANKIWLLNSSISKACVMNNDEILRTNFSSAFEEAMIMPGKAEGIKIDNSFYQHGPQLYTAGYGMSFLGDITSFGVLAHGTEYAMTASQLKVLTDVVLDGYQWFCQNNAFDFSATGREISRRAAGSSIGLKTHIERLLSMNAPRREELENFIRFIDGKADFQSPGNRHFWKSDIMVQHGPDFYFSARVPSKRTNGTERMNNENLKRKWLPWGATALMKQGDEYRNLFSVWDWSRIPGVTSLKEEVKGLPVTGGAYLVSDAEFAGGVSDGSTGLAAYDYSWDGVSGRKTWFFTPEAMYCLGANIRCEKDNTVLTSVNQCFSSGSVSILNAGKKKIFDGQEINSEEVEWIHHDGFGYYFPTGGNISLRNMDQTGSWSEINASASSEKVTYKVFSIWFDHGTKPASEKYEYVVVPSKDPVRFSKWLKKNPFEVLTNTEDVQAVFNKKSGIYGIAFYNPGSVTIEEGLYIGADEPCLILFRNSKKAFSITVSDPTQNLEELDILVSRKLSGKGVKIDEKGNSTITVKLPSGDEAGKSVSNEYLTM